MRYFTPTLAGAALGILAAGCSGAQQPQGSADPPLLRARAAFMASDVAAAERAYRDVLQDTTIGSRTEAMLSLASIAWRVRGDTADASRVLREGLSRADTRAAAFAERARMLTALGRPAEASAAADSAWALALRPNQRRTALVARATALLARHRRSAATTTSAATTGGDSALAAVVRDLATLVAQQPGRIELARLLVETAAFSGNGPALLAGWRSYYLVGTGDTTGGVLAAPRRVLATVAPRLGSSHEQPGDRLAVAHALIDSRFFEAPLSVAGASAESSGDARLRDVAAYVDFLRDVQTSTDAYYRDVAMGRANRRRWRGELDESGARLWKRLTWPGGNAPDYDFEKMDLALRDRFGTFITTGETAGTSDLHLGHAVVDDRRTVTQYGHSATVRFAALDHMASNGYQSWAWDGRAAHGGWATAQFIAQVRPRYSEGPLNAWHDVSDSTDRAATARQIARDSASDVARGRATPVAYFPSVVARMRRDALSQLHDSLARAGLRGPAHEVAFLKMLGDDELEIFAHEGRHAIDKTIGVKGGAEELEFRGKLSQIVFVPRPRLNMGGILGASLGDATPHGKANARIARGLVAWLAEHGGEIPGLDPAAPLLPQLPLLSDDKLREAFRSMDPLAGAR